MNISLPDNLTISVFDSKKNYSSVVTTPPRVVQNYEFEYYFESGGIVAINNIEYKVQKNYILFAKPGDIRYSRPPFTCKFIHFTLTDETLISEFQKIKPYFYAGKDNDIESFLKSLRKHWYSSNVFDKITASAELLLFLRSLIFDKEAISVLISQAKEFIKSNYHNDISIKNIADACFTSESYLYKLFKKKMNITIGEYITNCRIAAACDLLTNTEMSLLDIAFQCGFNSQSYFSYCFKKNTGLSPKDFKKSYSP